MLDFADIKRKSVLQALRQHLEGEVRFDDATRRLYSTDASVYQILPMGVVIPKTPDDLTVAVQVAAELETPIVPRGGGTSLSGQSIGPGLVIDCSKHLNSILDVDAGARIARVQPGVVLDQLNRALAEHGLQFGPDVATANRANLGGMIGNNSAGARSIVYGKTGDHVRRLELLLSDGSRLSASPLSAAAWNRKAEAATLEGAIYRSLRPLIAPHGKEIRRRFPNIIRRVSGYNLRDLLPAAEPGRPVAAPGPGLLPLIVGSEGTLGVIAEAELNLVPRPAARGLLVIHFLALTAALDALAACLETGPSAVELLDAMLIELASRNLSLKDAMAAIRGRPAALLMVEYQGDSAADVAGRVADLQRRLGSFPGVTACVPAVEPNAFQLLWNMRSAAVPLLFGLPGDRKPITFVEDTAVAPEQLPAFAKRFREVLRRHGTDGAFYGHASVGCLHIRPVLNLKDSADIARMRRISDEITDLVLEYKGSLSGEHGDGLARSEWNRKMFGPIVYELFQQVKRLFDPKNLFNPGKVVDAPAMTDNLRYGPEYRPAERATIFDYSRQEGFFRSIELCNGAGVCRKTQGGSMCPSYRATRDERDTTRARANALRLTLVENPPVATSGLAARWVHDVMDLCLMCKACKAECPSNVDMAKLKAEFLHAYHQEHLRPLGHRAMARIHRINRWAAPVAPLVNWLGKKRWMRLALELVGGIDRRRSLPALSSDHFRSWFRRHAPDANAGRVGRVILLEDCFTTYQEPAIGRAAVRVLERAGYAVELAGLDCCGRAMISKGFLLDARKLAQRQVTGLARRVTDGTPILGLEPSCLLTLADEWPELVPSPESRRVAAATALTEGWLAKQISIGQCHLALSRRSGECVFHGHCHQKALRAAAGTTDALRLISGWDVTTLDAGCCGMAGSFGYESGHYDVSVQIAELQLLPALRAAPNAVIAATGTSCRHQIRDLAGRSALHPLEILEQSMDGAT
jgi:FAD/FMN-containing dehydrogenase/Fe-S oxidoreductase